MIYLATPYSSDDPAVMRHRYNVVTKVAAELMKRGEMVFSPITHSHPIAQHLNKETAVDWKAWERFDTKLLKCCSELCVLMLPGWKESVGVNAEIKLANKLGKRITYINDKLETLMIEQSRVEEV